MKWTCVFFRIGLLIEGRDWIDLVFHRMKSVMHKRNVFYHTNTSKDALQKYANAYYMSRDFSERRKTPSAGIRMLLIVGAERVSESKRSCMHLRGHSMKYSMERVII